MKLYISFIFVVIFLSSDLRAAKTNKEMTLTPLSQLKARDLPRRGRLAQALIYLDVDSLAPSIKIQRLNMDIEDLDDLAFDEELSSSFIRVRWTISLKGFKKGIYSMPLKSGVYQIVQVNAPYYNLPFELSTEDDPRWRFRVYPNSMNYIGHLKISKERDAENVESYFLDRFYSDKEEIDAEISRFPQPIKVVHGVQTHTKLELDNGGEK
jgi:hypothetical protein